MLKKITLWLDPILLTGLLISITVSIVMVLSGNDTLSGLTIGLLSTILTLLIDVIARVQRAESSSLGGNKEISKNLEQATTKIVSSLQGVSIRSFDRREDVYLYLETRLKHTERYVDLMHASPNMPINVPSGRRYYEALSDVVRSNKVRVRRIVIVSTQEQLSWVHSMLNEFSGHPFFLGCYTKLSSNIPFLNFVLIDDEEVIITGGARNLSFDVKTIAIRHPEFVAMLKDHFDEMWRNCIKLSEKEATTEILNQLKVALGHDDRI